uniref:Uncharacterized protein n=1 Tax=Arundo donax TaxID=35708 RepID=A0A0A9C7R4_ARUDO
MLTGNAFQRLRIGSTLTRKFRGQILLQGLQHKEPKTR